MTALRRLLALLALLLPVAFGAAPLRAADPCVLCKDARALKCPTCFGSGEARGPCEACEGRGSTACPVRRATLSEADEAKLGRAVGTHAGTERLCPNRACDRGKVAVDAKSKVTCRVCSGRGRVPCAFCRTAGQPCGICKGGRTSVRPCTDCGVTGTVACLLCAPPDATCPQCAGRRSLPCKPCGGKRLRSQPCIDCLGRGSFVCVRCDGFVERACDGCSGTGKDLARAGGGSPSKSCAKCAGRGTTSGFCVNRERHFVDAARDVTLTWCPSCAGQKKGESACRTCETAEGVSCRACGPRGFRIAEIEAGVLSRAAAADAARRLLALAKSTAEASVSVTAAEIRDLPSLRQKLDRDPNVSDPTAGYREIALRERMLKQLDEEFRAAVARIEKSLAALNPAPPGTEPGGPK